MWLPLDIDPENCDFKDVDRVLRVLDDYALSKLGVVEREPKMRQIVFIQRQVRTFLRTTRLVRCVRDGMKMIRAVKAMQRFADRAPYQAFFMKFERVFRKQIELDRAKRAKQQRRQAKIDAGEAVSDTSSVKEKKRIEKAKLMEEIFKKHVHEPIVKTQKLESEKARASDAEEKRDGSFVTTPSS